MGRCGYCIVGLRRAVWVGVLDRGARRKADGGVSRITFGVLTLLLICSKFKIRIKIRFIRELLYIILK